MIVPVLGALMRPRRQRPGRCRAFRHPGILARCVAEIGAALLYLSALFHMPIADCTAILQFTPLALTAGAALFLGARVGWRRWLATFVGLIGVLIIIRPGAAAFNPYAMLALLSVAFIAARDLITRTLGAERADHSHRLHVHGRRRTVQPRPHAVRDLAMAVVRGGARPRSAPAWRCSAHNTGSSSPCAPATSPWSPRSATPSSFGPSWRASWCGARCPISPPGSASRSSPPPASTPSCASTGWRKRRAT